jgi:phosphatidate cytidylyltransferase
MSDPKTPGTAGASEATAKKKNSLVQRVITALVLVTALALVLWAGGWVFAGVVCLCVAVAIHEMHSALRAGGHHPARWVAYAGLLLGVPLMMLYPDQTIIPLLMLLTFCVLVHVMLRPDPELTDVLVSVMPVFSVVLPALCLVGLQDCQPRSLQLMLLIQAFGIAVGGDTLAYFVGSAVGGPKLCPRISPNKTIAGSVGGLLGSVLMAVLVGRIFAAAAPDLGVTVPLWAEILLGFIGGCAGQMGDLFASMVKRHCKVKDYGTIFPGHGGMMDRLDSVFFVAIVVYCFRVILLA